MYEHDGILPIIDLLSLKERNALAAATGAVWKCAQSEENAKRYVGRNGLPLTAICVQAQTANIFARLFTFETGRLPLETECFTAHVTSYSSKPNSVIFHVLMCFRVRFSVSKLTIL